MGRPLLKAQYNRVRTSTALQGNSMWSDTIGVEQEMGANSAIEASIPAPSFGRGLKVARMEKAQDLIQQAGYQPKISTMEGLLSLAKTQGATGNATRGACKICGGLGHLTKACKNGVSGHKGDMDDLDLSAAVASTRAMLPDLDEVSSLDSDDLRSSDDSSSSDSGSGSDGERRKRKRSSSKHSKKDKKPKKSHSKKSKKEKSSDRDKSRKKDKKEKKERKEKKRSSSRERGAAPQASRGEAEGHGRQGGSEREGARRHADDPNDEYAIARRGGERGHDERGREREPDERERQPDRRRGRSRSRSRSREPRGGDGGRMARPGGRDEGERGHNGERHRASGAARD